MKWTSVTLVVGFIGTFAFASCKQAGYDTFMGKSKSNDDQSSLVLKSNVEIVDGDKVLTEAITGQTVTIRPTKDSAYGPVQADCLNAGIVTINYDAGDAYKQTVTRAKGCEPSSITHAFAKAGDYVITMVSLTADGKTISSQAKLKVKAAPATTPTPNPVVPNPVPNPMPPGGITQPPQPMNPQNGYYCDPCQQQPVVYYYRPTYYQPCSC